MSHNKLVLRGLIAASALMIAAPLAVANTISGSKHDFSGLAWGQGQICKACHVPHNSKSGATNVNNAPLWNHTLSTAVYTMYNATWSPTMNGTVAAQPAATSKLCMSCHDGTIAIDNFGGSAYVAPGTSIAANANLGIDMRDDHPIGVTYNTALSTTDGALFDPVTKAVTIGTGGGKTKTGTVDTTMLIGGQLECASCHDVHNTFTVTTAGAYTGATSNKLLKVTLQGSTLCLTCHDK